MNLPRIGAPVPDFTEKAALVDQVINISLNDYKDKYLILLFYPMDFAYVCPTELVAFNDSIKELRALNTEVVACSVDSYHSHLRWLSIPQRKGGIHGLQIPIIDDKSRRLAQKYGVLDEEAGYAYRAMFIIDGRGILRQITVNDRNVGRNISEAYRLIKTMYQADQLCECTPNKTPLKVSRTNSEKQSLLKCSEKYQLCELIE